MAFLPPFGGAFQAPIATPVGAKWWLSGGIASTNCVIAYQPKNAVSLAASYINLANPGTYNAAPGTAPTWASATGWTFTAASSQYLTTGFTAANNNYSLLVRFSNATGIQTYLFGSWLITFWGLAPRFAGTHYYSNGGFAAAAGDLTTNIMGFAGTQAYLNAVADGVIGGGAIPVGHNYIGARNQGGIPVNFFSGNILAIAVYSVILTPTEYSAVNTAMATL